MEINKLISKVAIRKNNMLNKVRYYTDEKYNRERNLENTIDTYVWYVCSKLDIT